MFNLAGQDAGGLAGDRVAARPKPNFPRPSVNIPLSSAIACAIGFARAPGSKQSRAAWLTANPGFHRLRTLRAEGSNDGHEAIAAILPDGTCITIPHADFAPFVAHAAASASATARWTSGTMVV